MQNMKLSIITVNLNNRDGLQKTIDSVISQTFKDFEWIVIDGGSTDGSRELIELYSEHFAYWVSEPDKGIYNAMNKGIRVAKGEYLQFLNSGDCLLENGTLEKVFAEQHNEKIIYGDAVFTSPQGDTYSVFPDTIRPYFFFDENLCHQATFSCRKLLQESIFDEEYKVCSDLDFFIKTIVINNCSYKHLNITVCNFDNTGVSSNRILVRQERDAIICKHFPENILKELLRLQDFDNTTNPKLKRNIDIIAHHTNLFRLYKYITKLVASLCPSK